MLKPRRVREQAIDRPADRHAKALQISRDDYTGHLVYSQYHSLGSIWNVSPRRFLRKVGLPNSLSQRGVSSHGPVYHHVLDLGMAEFSYRSHVKGFLIFIVFGTRPLRVLPLTLCKRPKIITCAKRRAAQKEFYIPRRRFPFIFRTIPASATGHRRTGRCGCASGTSDSHSVHTGSA